MLNEVTTGMLASHLVQGSRGHRLLWSRPATKSDDDERDRRGRKETSGRQVTVNFKNIVECVAWWVGACLLEWEMRHESLPTDLNHGYTSVNHEEFRLLSLADAMDRGNGMMIPCGELCIPHLRPPEWTLWSGRARTVQYFPFEAPKSLL